MFAYWGLLGLTAVVPLALSFARWQLRWGKREWLRLLRVFMLVSVPFVLLDALSHARGWWAYNPHFITGVRLAGLPLEEIMFFFVIPFACLYLYSAAVRVAKDSPIGRLWLWRMVLGIFVAASILLAATQPKERTIVDAAVFIAVAVAAMVRPPTRLGALWLTVVVGLFLVVNTVLTALPIVTYDTAFGSAYRLGTIPFEDVLYNFNFLYLCLLVWHSESPRKLSRAARRS